MIDIDKWQEIFQSLSKHKLRTALTALGVFWGIFMLMILVGAGTGLQNGVYNMFGGMSRNALFVWTQKTKIPYKGYQAGRRYRFSIDDEKAIREQIPEANKIAPRVWAGNNVVNYGNKTATFQTRGDVPDFFDIEPSNLYKGRFINQLDIDEKRKVAVIGQRVADVLFEEDEEPLGKYFKMRGAYFQVIGVFKSFKGSEDGAENEQSMHIPITTAQQITNMGREIGWFAMTPDDGVRAAVLDRKVRRLLAKRHTISPEDKQAIGSANVEEEFQQFQNVFTGIKGFTWFVGILTMIAGVVGIGNIMLITVKERTREIGLRKALGATPWSINLMLIQESILLTTIAGYGGLVAGVGLIELVKQAMIRFDVQPKFFGHPEIYLGTAIAAIIMLVIFGTLAGLIPASHAARIKPIEALRTE